MKYAFIALIALYLIIYGCSPDSSEKAKESHEPAAQTAVKDPHDGEKAAVALEHQQPAEAVQQGAKNIAHETAKPAQSNIEAPVVIMKQPVITEQKPAKVVESEQVVLPCGRVIARADIPEDAPPCLKMQTLALPDTAAATGTEQELETALQKMVQTTNDMVLATRKLVIAAQALLDADKKTAGETKPAEQAAPSKEAAPAHQ